MKTQRKAASPLRLGSAWLLLALALIYVCPPFQGWAGDRLTRQQAKALIQQLPQVKKNLAVGSPPCKLLFEEEEPHRYVFRLVLFLPGDGEVPPRATCIGWYAVDKKTRRAYERLLEYVINS